MSRFMSGMSNMVEKDCSTTMFLHYMDISHLMVFAQQVEEEKIKEESSDKKRSRKEDDDRSHARSDGHGRLRLREKFSRKSSSIIPKFNQERVSNPMSQDNSSGVLLPGCNKCDRMHAPSGFQCLFWLW